MAGTAALIVVGALLAAVGATGAVIASNALALTPPPGPAARLSDWLFTNHAELRPDASYPELRSPVYDIDAAALMRAVEQAAERFGWEAPRTSAQRRFSAEVVSRWLRFRDDIEVWPVVLDDGSVRLEGRSRSRVGRGDLGMNASHLVRLVEALERALPRAERDGRARKR